MLPSKTNHPAVPGGVSNGVIDHMMQPAMQIARHPPFCCIGLVAGAGVRGGTVYGESDEIARFPKEDPLNSKDLIATIRHSTGISQGATLNDLTDRPHFLYGGSPNPRLVRSAIVD